MVFRFQIVRLLYFCLFFQKNLRSPAYRLRTHIFSLNRLVFNRCATYLQIKTKIKNLSKYFDPLSSCLHCKLKFDDCPIAYKNVIGSNPFAIGRNGTSGSVHLCPICQWFQDQDKNVTWTLKTCSILPTSHKLNFEWLNMSGLDKNQQSAQLE